MQPGHPERRAIVILGAPRSGAALLARMLATLGATVATHTHVLALSEEVLATLGGPPGEAGAWLASGAGPAASRALLADWLVREWGDRAAAALAADLADDAPTILADPELTPLLPLWRAAFARAGLTPTWLLSLRHPQAVARSLERRTGLAARRGYLMWQGATLDVLDGAGDVVVAQHEELVERPAATMAALATRLGLAAPGDAADRQRALIDRSRVSPFDASDALLPAQSRQTWRLAAQWSGVAPDDRAQRLAGLRKRFDDAVLVTGGGRVVPELAAPAARSTAARHDTVVVHYHLFKNAGSSVDEMLRRNFGKAWGEQEFDATGGVNAPAVCAYLQAHPALVALSSHSALLPLPELPGVRVFPILFVRHPLLRLKSAYSFERKQKVDTYGARLARGTDLCGYLDALVDAPGNRQARNFQAHRFALGQPRDAGSERARALATLAALPFVGLVEAYDASLARLEAVLAPLLPGFKAISVRRNVTAKNTGLSVGAQLAALRAELGEARFDRLLAANADDAALFDAVSASYGLDR